jgi:hypothetical protein
VRYTKNPANFLAPTTKTIEHIAVREGLGALTSDEMDFVWDMLAKTAGAEVRDFDEIKAQAEAAAHAIGEAQAFVDRFGTTRWSVEDLICRFEGEYHAHQHHRYQALAEIDLNQVPGYNKATQAVRLIKLFRALQVLWILHIIRIEYGLSFAEMLTDAIASVNELSDQQMSMLEDFVGGDEPREDAIVLGLELSFNGIQIVEMLRIARKLDELAELRSRSKLRPDPNGEDVTLRGIRELSELGRATQDAFTLPQRLRMQRAVSGELNVRDPRTRRDQKQLLFMVVDGSASMLHYRALGASRAAGVVVNRLRAVISGDAELYVRFFDSNLREEEFHADSPASARELIRVVSRPQQYLGGFTIFEATLAAASTRAEQILSSRGLRDPEIVFVTDGAAPVPELSVLGGKKLHVFQVGESENLELSELARKSGGVGVYLGLEDWN